MVRAGAVTDAGEADLEAAGTVDEDERQGRGRGRAAAGRDGGRRESRQGRGRATSGRDGRVRRPSVPLWRCASPRRRRPSSPQTGDRGNGEWGICVRACVLTLLL